MSEIVPILGARTLRFWRTLCEQNELSGGLKCPTSVVLLGGWEGFFFLQEMAPSSFAHPTLMYQKQHRDYSNCGL